MSGRSEKPEDVLNKEKKRNYYLPEVSSMKYCCLGLFRKEYSRLFTK